MPGGNWRCWGAIGDVGGISQGLVPWGSRASSPLIQGVRLESTQRQKSRTYLQAAMSALVSKSSQPP